MCVCVCVSVREDVWLYMQGNVSVCVLRWMCCVCECVRVDVCLFMPGNIYMGV